jgi:hypothetical protein
MKKLGLGITAIAALAVTAYWMQSPRPAAVAGLPAAEPVSSPTPSNVSPPPTSDASLQPGAVRPQQATSHRETQRPDTQNVLPSSQARSPQPAPSKDEAQQMAACHARWDSKKKREQAAHDAEAKDPAWAYAMEQKLREYASQRLRGTSIELKEVDCKTTFCDLLMEVFDPNSTNEMNNALEDAKKQPWSDFSGTSWAKTSDEGTTYRVELSRRHSYRTPFESGNDEQDLACTRLISDRTVRERAARDAQPRDVAWADQLEPLLRQHIMSRTGKHPPTKLDIVCKTTFCQIKAGGETEESQRLFQQVSQEAAAEPWANLRNGEAGSSGYGNRWTADVTLYRQ